MSIAIEIVNEATDEVVVALGRLMPQLSSSVKPIDREALARVIACDANTLLVARVEGEVVGTLTLVTFPLASGLRARIEDVVVDERTRGMGIGALLTQQALRLAENAGARTLDLTSRPTRPAANRLYERLGFQPRESTIYRYALERPSTQQERGQAISSGSLSRSRDRSPAVTGLEPVAWPPAPIRTERLVLRESEPRDRAVFVELFASPEVGTYIGGPRPRDELERTMPEAPGRRPGLFVIDLDGAMIGMITFDRRDVERPGHVRPEGGETELGYMLLPGAWGRGYAAEACAAALGWFADAHPGEPVVLCTQTANDSAMRLAAKLGFTEVERFEEYGAEQWFGVWSAVTPSS